MTDRSVMAKLTNADISTDLTDNSTGSKVCRQKSVLATVPFPFGEDSLDAILV